MSMEQITILCDQVLDSLTASNIAISALHMVLSVLLVAFITDDNTLGIFFYILFTDIVSTVPFLLKGIELLIMACHTRAMVTALFTGDDNLGQLEISVSACGGR